MASAAFGIKVNILKNPDNEFCKAGQEVVSFILWKLYKAVLLSTLPFLKNFIVDGLISSRTTPFFDNLIQNLIKDRKKTGLARPDMVQSMVEAAKKKNGIKVSNDDITDNCMICFLGGFDTSSNFMSLMGDGL